MIQAIVKKGKVLGEEIPAPVVSKGRVLIKVIHSCISAGTEMSSVNRSGKSLIKIALEQPNQVKEAFNMVKAKGLSKTFAKIRGVVDSGKPIGYSLSGMVLAVGSGVNRFEPGDLVAAAGAGLANHAEYVDVPENLVMKIPKNTNPIHASTVTLGGIAIQGVRRADLKLGELGVVLGTGILGLLAVQMLNASGVRVAAVDLDDNRLAIAKKLGAELTINSSNEDFVKLINNWSNGYGADAVLFTAATNDSVPLSLSFQACKKKGKVILVGVSGMQINRGDIYPKELDFLISTSYGPGRYDRDYEQKGCDYPYGYVRWTENRNMSEYLRLLNEKKIKLDDMITDIFPIAQVDKAFEALKNDKKPIMVILDYGKFESNLISQLLNHDRKIIINNKKVEKDKINVALIGAGSFATGMHLPNIAKLNAKYKLYCVMDKVGHTAKAVTDQYSAQYSTTNYSDILTDQNVDLVMICTQHSTHASLILQALNAGKNVFVEKPLATSSDDLMKIKDFYSQNVENKPVLMVGFNRRFSKYAVEIKAHTDKRINPLFLNYRMNAGFIPLDKWIHENGGRIVGEGCHIIDLMTYFTGCEIKSISFEKMSPSTKKYSPSDNMSIILKYMDGSVATINYFAVGNKSYPKEFLEVHFDEKTITMDDYKKLNSHGINIKNINSQVSEKGHFEELIRLYETIKGGNPAWPIELWDMLQTTQTTLLITENG